MILGKETITEQLFSFMLHQGHITHESNLARKEKFLLNDFIRTTRYFSEIEEL